MADDFLSEEDKKLFRAFINAFSEKSSQKRNRIQEEKDITGESNFFPLHLTSDNYLAQEKEITADTVLFYHHPQFIGPKLKNFRQGKILWERKIDLHGLDGAKAKEKLAHFINKYYSAGYRSFLIIHGKGGKQYNHPILKSLIHCWLSQMEEVLSFCSALPFDGGTGAIYLYLKKIK